MDNKQDAELCRVLTISARLALAALALAALLLALLGGSGCASSSQTLGEKFTIAPDGTKTYERRTDVREKAVGDAKQSIGKVKTSNTEKTQSVGLSDVSSESASASTIKEIKELLQIVK